MNWSILIPAIIVILGWGVVHYFNTKRDRQNKLRDIHIQYLIEAYRNLANSSHRFPEKNSPYFRQIEMAIADIQLFGTTSQIEKVHLMLPEYSKTATLSLDPLLNDLRNTLRTELNLPLVRENVQWLRMEGAPSLPNTRPHDKP